MQGHEFARTRVASKLTTNLPTYLAAVRTRLGVSWPPDPETILVADEVSPSIGQMPNIYPSVLIRSTELLSLTPISRADGWWGAYRMSVGVLCASRSPDPQEAAVGRDRIMLAIRELLLADRSLGDDEGSTIVLDPYTERTGAAEQTLGSVPMSAGVIEFAARVFEPPYRDLVTIVSASIEIAPIDPIDPQ